MSFSDYLENSIITTLFHASSYVYSPPGTYYVGLSSTNPQEDWSGDTPPSTGRGYARVALDNAYNSDGFTQPVNGSFSNSGTVEFPENTGTLNWGEMTYFTMWDASTSGNMVVYGALRTPKTVRVGDILKFQSGDLQIVLDGDSLHRDLVSFWKMEAVASDTLSDTYGFNSLYVHGDSATTPGGILGNALSLPSGDTYVTTLSNSVAIFGIDPSRSSGIFKLTDRVAYSLLAGDVIRVTGNSISDNNTEWTVAADGTGYFFDVTGIPDTGTGGSYYLVAGPSYVEGLRFKDSDFTVAFWSKLGDKTNTQNPISTWDNNAKQYTTSWDKDLRRYRLKLSSDGVSETDVYFAKHPVETGVWHHLVATYDASENKTTVIMDGAVSTTGSHVGGTHDNNAAFLIGATGFPGGIGQYSYGDIDEVGVWRRILTDDEITILYGGGTGVAYNNFDSFNVSSRINISSGLVSHWDFDSTAVTGNSLGGNQYDFAYTGTFDTVVGVNGGDAVSLANNYVYIDSGRVGWLNPGTNNFSFSLWLNGTIFKDSISYWGMSSDGDINDITSTDLDLYSSGTTVPTGGIINSGIYFDGASSYSSSYVSGVELRNMSSYTGLTVAAWVNNLVDTSGTIARLHGSSTQYQLWYDSASGNYKFSLSGVHVNSLHSAPLSTWQYVVGRWDGSDSGSISINASCADYSAVSGLGVYDTKANLNVGYEFDGGIDEVGIWGRPITPTEMSYLYNSGSGRNLDSLVNSIFKLDSAYELYTSGDRVVFKVNSLSESASVTGVGYLGKPGWKHIVGNVDYDADTITIYINGQQTESINNLSGVRGHTGVFELARDGVLSLQLDEMSFWHGRTLSYDDVLGLYNFGNGRNLEWMLEN